MEKLIKGSHVYPDGSSYTGQYRNGLRHGTGSMTFANYDLYEGDWEDDRMSGYGEYHFYDADRDKFVATYKGDFVNSRFHGKGTLSCRNGSAYEGEWENGVRCGSGVLTCSSGKVIKGVWRDNRLVTGECQYPDGTRAEGVWEDDELTDGKVFNADGTLVTVSGGEVVKLQMWKNG